MTRPSMTSSSAFANLRRAYENPFAAAEAARARGVRLVGYIGPTVPLEIVLAAGLFPMAITGDEFDARASNDLMEEFFDPDCRFAFDGLLNERFGDLALMVVPRTSDQYNKLYLYLREAVRIGRGNAVPALWLYDLLHTRTKRSRDYGLARTAAFAQRMGEVAGRPINEGDLSRAIRATNAARKLMHQLQRARAQGVDGVEALMALSAFRFMGADEYVAAMTEYCSTVDGAAAALPRIVIKGFPLNHTRLHAMVAEAGGVVVGEDDPWGARAAGPLIAEDGDPLTAIFEHYFMHAPGPRVDPPEERDRWFVEQAPKADGVIFYVPPHDDLSGWDLPRQRSFLDRSGVRHVTIRCDAGQAGAEVTLRHELGGFVGNLVARVAGYG